MKLIDRAPLRLVPVDRPYEHDYWQFIDGQVLGASTDYRRRRVPIHPEIGLNGIHLIEVRRTPWWRRLLRRTPWRDVALIVAVVAFLLIALFFSGRSINLP